MKTIYAGETIENNKKSIFLAGPSPRNKKVISWRKEAIEILKELRFDGIVYIPEPRNGEYPENYINQIEWEEEALNKANCILFWIPRDLKELPGYTTNDEWGYWKGKSPEKLVLGVPDNSPKTKYQIYYAKKYNIPFSENLKETIINALKKN